MNLAEFARAHQKKNNTGRMMNKFGITEFMIFQSAGLYPRVIVQSGVIFQIFGTICNFEG